MSNSNPWTGQQTVETSDGLTLAVHTAGDQAAPTVILIHGYPDTHEVWNDVAATLAKTMHVVAYDVRGAGESGIPARRSGYLLEQLSSDLNAVADAVSPDQPVHLAAHDWGSMQTWEAVTDPGSEKRFASFTSMSGPCLDHVAHATRRMVRERPTAALMQAGRSWYIAMFQIPKLPELVLARGVVRRFAPDSTGSTSDAIHGIELYRANIRRTLLRPRERHTSVPVQLLIATADPYAGPDIFEGVGQWTQELVTVEINGGHWLPRTHADEVAARVLSFVGGRQ